MRLTITNTTNTPHEHIHGTPIDPLDWQSRFQRACRDCDRWAHQFPGQCFTVTIYGDDGAVVVSYTAHYSPEW